MLRKAKATSNAGKNSGSKNKRTAADDPAIASGSKKLKLATNQGARGDRCNEQSYKSMATKKKSDSNSGKTSTLIVRKRKCKTADDAYMSETINDSKKPKLATNQGASEDGCNELVVTIQLNQVKVFKKRSQTSAPNTPMEAKLLTSQKLDVNSVNKDGLTLHEWCKFKGDRIGAIKALLKDGATVNHQDSVSHLT